MTAKNLTRDRAQQTVEEMVASPSTVEAPALTGPLTWSEICAHYPEQWVALVEIDWVNENDLDFRSARVAGHGKTRKEPLDQARPLRARYDEIGHFFTGPIRAPLRAFLMPCRSRGSIRRAISSS
jgi:hypothetical protein